MVQPAYEVLKFSEANFCYCLSNNNCSPEEVAKRSNTRYFFNYFRSEEVKVKTLVLEYNYIDRDYLDDYSNYYLRCFRNYERHCKRLHFFAMDLSETDFIEIIRGSAPSDVFKTAYKGFLVVRPLPQAIVGRTVLTPYPFSSSDGSHRYFPCTKKCVAHLFGIELTLDSLEYQEQDTVLAACATVALWCCFHKTNQKFQTPIWSLADITRAANELTHPFRSFPSSNGLYVNQISDAIVRNGLVPEIYTPNHNGKLLRILYGYLKFGLPVILAINIQGIGLHAITLTGYSLQEELKLEELKLPEFSRPDDDFIPFSASRIIKFYAHDDQIGPFSRLEFRLPETEEEAELSDIVFYGSWEDEDGKFLRILPETMIIPIYHKIRLRFEDVEKWLERINWILFTSDEALEHLSLEWDVYLTTVNDLKCSIGEMYHMEEEKLDDVLFSSHPRFIWRATLKLDSKPWADFFADATDMSRSFPFYQMLIHSDSLRDSLDQVINADDWHGISNWQSILVDKTTLSFVTFLKNNLL